MTKLIYTDIYYYSILLVCNIKNYVYFAIKFVTYNKSPKTYSIRSNFSIKQARCIGIQVNNSYAI